MRNEARPGEEKRGVSFERIEGDGTRRRDRLTETDDEPRRQEQSVSVDSVKTSDATDNTSDEDRVAVD